MDIIVLLADAIPGRPNLDHPRVRLAVVAQAGAWRLGRVVSAASGDWREWTPPVDFSAALPPQIARALVNLVAAPGDTLLDPCCGVGTVVAQAAQRGMRAVGVEISKKLAGRAAECVYRVHPPAPLPEREGGGGTLIVAGDGREIGGRFDAAVVDLPYGRSSLVTPGLYRDVLTNLSGLVPRAAIVAARPLGEALTAAGFRLLRMARARSGGLVRHVHLVASVRVGEGT
jgi:tRNA G10  N-methylase Trm11